MAGGRRLSAKHAGMRNSALTIACPEGLAFPTCASSIGSCRSWKWLARWTYGSMGPAKSLSGPPIAITMVIEQRPWEFEPATTRGSAQGTVPFRLGAQEAPPLVQRQPAIAMLE